MCVYLYLCVPVGSRYVIKSSTQPVVVVCLFLLVAPPLACSPRNFSRERRKEAKKYELRYDVVKALANSLIRECVIALYRYTITVHY
jgi:hypothetical protein